MAGNVSMSGLVSNMDTDSIVEALVSAYSQKKDKLVKAQTKLEWKQDAWKDLNTKIYSFYSSKLSPLRFSSAFSLKTSSANSSKVSVKAGSDAVTGTQKLKITKLAKSGYLTGAVVKRDPSTGTDKITGKSKLSELGIKDKGSIAVSVDGKNTNIELSSNMTVNEAVVKFKEAGLNASFDEKNQRFFVSSKNSGEKGDFSMTANDVNGVSALNLLGLNYNTDAEIAKYKELSEMTDDVIAEKVAKDYAKQKTALYDINDEKTMKKIKDSLQSALEKATAANENVMKANKKIEAKQAAVEEVKDLNFDERSELLSEANDQLNQYALELSNENLTDEEKAELQAKVEELQAKREVYVASTNDTFNAETYSEQLTKEKEENDKIIETNTNTIETATNALADDEGFKDYIDAENQKITDKNAALEAKLNTFYETQRSDAKKYYDAYNLVHTEGVDKTSQEYKDAIALVGVNPTDGTGAVRISGQDAIIELNGAMFTSESNNFQVNGLTITVNELTADDEEISITTDTDVDGIYNMITDFFKSYNELIKEMDTLYNADSSKGYEPLTDDEKEAMTEKEIEKWEEKIKTSILRRDSTLGTVSDAIKNAFQKVYNINGTNYSLSSFGIKTGGYFSTGNNEKSMFHIDGDKDDATSSGNVDKLRSAIASDPETVMTFFNKLANDVYDELSNRMRRTTMSSAYTVYNDKAMQNEYKSYKDQISEWEDRIERYEEKYRKQFTAMETALSKLNSNSSALAGLLGS